VRVRAHALALCPAHHAVQSLHQLAGLPGLGREPDRSLYHAAHRAHALPEGSRGTGLKCQELPGFAAWARSGPVRVDEILTRAGQYVVPDGLTAAVMPSFFIRK